MIVIEESEVSASPKSAPGSLAPFDSILFSAGYKRLPLSPELNDVATTSLIRIVQDYGMVEVHTEAQLATNSVGTVSTVKVQLRERPRLAT